MAQPGFLGKSSLTSGVSVGPARRGSAAIEALSITAGPGSGLARTDQEFCSSVPGS